jgi:hypothetical protein
VFQVPSLFAKNLLALKTDAKNYDMKRVKYLKIIPNSVRDTYIQNVEKLYLHCSMHVRSYHIDYVKADINAGFQQVLLQYW